MPDSKATTTDWRIVGVSGDTIDGRLINAQELEEMAAQYDPEIYGARINLEHVNFLLPDYAGGYGDVLELKTEPWHKDPSKTALLAKLAVMPALQKLWDEGKKIYTSMEIVRPFADTGKAYLAGLAITDTPASLGTTANFSRAAEQAGSQQTVFSAYRLLEETVMPQNQTQPQNQTADQPLTEVGAESLFARLLAKFTAPHKPEQPETQPTQPTVEQPQDYSQTIAELRQEYQAAGELVQKLLAKQEADDKAYNELAANHEKLRQEFDNLKQRLETEPAAGERQEHTGSGEPTPTAGW